MEVLLISSSSFFRHSSSTHSIFITRQGLVLSLFYRRGNRSPEGLHNVLTNSHTGRNETPKSDH